MIFPFSEPVFGTVEGKGRRGNYKIVPVVNKLTHHMG